MKDIKVVSGQIKNMILYIATYFFNPKVITKQDYLKRQGEPKNENNEMK